MDESLFILNDDPDQPEPSVAPSVVAGAGADPVTFDSEVLALHTIDTAREPTVDIYNTAIILVDKKPEKATIATLESIHELASTNVLGMNGKAIFKVINNPKDSGPLTKHLFLLPPSPNFTDTKQIPAEQQCFLVLFHHLHCLAVYNSIDGAPAFTDTFKEKYDFLQEALQADNAKLFGVDTKDPKLASLWTAIQEKTNTSSRISVTDLLERIQSGPKAVYKYISGATETKGQISAETPAGEVPDSSIAKAPVDEAPVDEAPVDEAPNAPNDENQADNSTSVGFRSTATPYGTQNGNESVASARKSAVNAQNKRTKEAVARVIVGPVAGPVAEPLSTRDEGIAKTRLSSRRSSINSTTSKQSTHSELLRTGLNRDSHEFTKGSTVLYEGKEMKVFRIQGSKNNPIEERVILLKNKLEDNNEEPIQVMQSEIQVVKRESKPRSVKFKKNKQDGGRRNITRKKNRTL